MVCIAYCILTYKEPERVARLVNRLHTDPDLMYIHFDTAIGKQRFRDWKRFVEQECPNKNIEIISKFRCKWGSFGIVDVILSAMKYYRDFNYDYFINLSGDCYPLKSPEAIKEEFKGQNSGFMEVFKMPNSVWTEGGMDRIQNRYYFIRRAEYPYVSKLRIPRLKKGLPCNLEPYGGSGWFCLPKQLVRYVIEFVKQNPSVRTFFKRALIPDEMFFQTILMNSPLRSRIVNDNKRYIIFKGAHPRFLTKDDLKNMMKSGKLFARKFNSEVDRDILDIIDQEIERY